MCMYTSYMYVLRAYMKASIRTNIYWQANRRVICMYTRSYMNVSVCTNTYSRGLYVYVFACIYESIYTHLQADKIVIYAYTRHSYMMRIHARRLIRGLRVLKTAYRSWRRNKRHIWGSLRPLKGMLRSYEFLAYDNEAALCVCLCMYLRMYIWKIKCLYECACMAGLCSYMCVFMYMFVCVYIYIYI
jgi:hypothetical protein